MRSSQLALALLLGVASGACSDDDRPPGYYDYVTPPPPDCDGVGDLRLCATNYYYSGYRENRIDSCNADDPITPIDAFLRTPLFRGNVTRDPDLAHQTRALQRYFEPHALWFETDALSTAYPISYVMRGTEDELAAAFDAAGLPPDGVFTAEQQALADQLAGEIIYADVRPFLAEHAQDPSAGVNIVVIPEIVAPELKPLLGLGDGQEVIGVGISPALFERVSAEDPNASLYTQLGVGREFTPTLFVGYSSVARFLRFPDVVIAHELGHALGLPHVQIAGNLMEPYARAGCRGGLLEEQVRSMGPFASGLDQPDCELPSLVGLSRRLVQAVQARRAAVFSKP